MWLAAFGPLLLAALLEVAVAAEGAASAATAASAGTAASAATATHGHHHHQQQQQVSGGSVGIAAAQSWIPYRHSALSLQGVQSVLLSIEERLRSLDASVYSSRYAPRWEVSLEQQGRRLEAVEARLGRLETLLEIRLDKLAESVSSRQLKEELSKDQMSRKFDSAYERLNHRLGYMEARLDVGVSKLQSSVEMASERVEAAVRGRQSGASTDAALLDLSVNVADLRRRVDDCQARSNDTVAAMASSSAHRLEDIASSLAQLRYDFNRTLASASTELHDASDQASSGPGVPDPSDYVEKVVVAMEKQVSNLANKVTNMYNELWRRTQVLETLTKDSMSLSNATRRELQDGLRSLSRRGAFHADREKQDTVGSLQESMDVLAGIVHRRMSELGRKLDSSFQMLMLAQNLFLESCHRLQLEEPQLEAKLTAVLGRILDTLHNKSASTMQEVQQVHEMLKSHHSHLVRTVAHNTNTVMKAAEEARNQGRQIERAIQEVTEALSAAGKDHAATLRHGHDAVDTRLANILGALQDLQDQLGEMVPDRSETSREIMNAEACLGNQKIITRIAADIEKHNTLLVTSLKDRGAVTTCPSIDIPEFTDKIALAFEGKGIVMCKANDDSNDVSQIIQPFDKSYTSENVFTRSNEHHDNDGKSNDIPGQRGEVWDKTNENISSASNGKSASLTSSSKNHPLNYSNLNDITENSSSESEGLFKTEGNRENSELGTTGNFVSQIQEQHNNSSQSQWKNILAIIHDTDTGESKEVQKPSLTIVHENSSGARGNEFSSSFHIPDAIHDQHDSNTTLLTRTPTEQEIQVIAFLRKPEDDETIEKENSSNVMRRSMNYTNKPKSVNTTMLAEEKPQNAPHDNSGGVRTSGNSEHVKQSDETEHAITGSTKTVNYTNARNFIQSEANVTSNEPYNLEMNFTNSGPIAIDQEHNTEVYVSEFLKKIMETYGTDTQVNKSIQDFWKVLLEKNHHLKTDEHTVENGTSAELPDTSKEEPNENSSYNDDYINYKNLEFHAQRLNISTIPETIKDVKIKQYVNKLEEIAHELSNRKESSLNNTGSTMNHTHIHTEQQYLSAQLTEEDDMSSY
ncbi:uncharacterized protein LOC126101140 [Schistocerca cancellata]|uniref:uncharacterized protein LOC126101140 n=1 Tax=Schistocerca cancellata TaxID=274614 RepID=UPI002119964D|nr:uncharacterized protein LOC126101140 [Schistocerca cancellata]